MPKWANGKNTYVSDGKFHARGFFGDVYRVKNTGKEYGPWHALKFIPTSDLVQANAFMNEVRAYAVIRHRNVGSIDDFFLHLDEDVRESVLVSEDE